MKARVWEKVLARWGVSSLQRHQQGRSGYGQAGGHMHTVVHVCSQTNVHVCACNEYMHGWDEGEMGKAVGGTGKGVGTGVWVCMCTHVWYEGEVDGSVHRTEPVCIPECVCMHACMGGMLPPLLL